MIESQTFLRQLLCTFSNDLEYKNLMKSIHSFYCIPIKFFIFSNLNDNTEIYLTYNILDKKYLSKKFHNTILIHRKKQTNTLYTLNAMNRLIEEENGVFDKSFVVNWELYKNSLILTDEISVRIVTLNFIGISQY